MSRPSFTISKRGDRWIAIASVGFKKPVEIDCGDGSKKAAEEFAVREVKRKHQLAEAGRIRWRNHHAAKAAAKVARAAAPAAPPIEREDPPDEPLSSGDNEPAPAPPPRDDPPAPAPPAPERAAEIAGRLRSLGDSDRPIEPDAVHGPGEMPGDQGEDPNDPPLDDEAGELLADIFAAALVTGHVKLIAKYLRKRKPPLRPGEPSEKMLAWERDGLSYNIAKIIGKSTRMGPTGKMLAGFAFMTLGMLVDAEPIEAAAGTPPPASSPRPPEPDGHAGPWKADNDNASRPDEPPPAGGGAQSTTALGRFQ